MFTASAVYPNDTVIGDEEYKIYSDVLAQVFPKTDRANNFVIYDQTSLDHGFSLDNQVTRDYFKKEFGDLFDLALEQRLQDLNKEPYKLENQFGNQLEVKLVSKDEVNVIFAPETDGWKLFYEKFPASYGTTTLSRVAFNDAGDTALFYYGNQSHYLAGAGYLVLLKKDKEQGNWVIVKQVLRWIS
jgi:hypothetical protein